MLNTSWREVGLPKADSEQTRWLRADLRAHPARCTLALWHDPVFSSGLNGGSFSYRPLWDALYAAGAELVLNGHDHDYERFAPQDPGGAYDPAHGIRQIVVGTGGFSHYSFGDGNGILANSEVRDDSDVRCPTPDATAARLRVAVHSGRWQHVHGCGLSPLPLAPRPADRQHSRAAPGRAQSIPTSRDGVRPHAAEAPDRFPARTREPEGDGSRCPRRQRETSTA